MRRIAATWLVYAWIATLPGSLTAQHASDKITVGEVWSMVHMGTNMHVLPCLEGAVPVSYTNLTLQTKD